MVIGLSAGLFACLCILVVVLLLVNFSPGFGWMRGPAQTEQGYNVHITVGNAADRGQEREVVAWILTRPAHRLANLDLVCRGEKT